MTREEVFNTIVNVPVIMKDNVEESDHLIYDLGLDSLDAAEISTELSYSYGVEICEEVILNIGTVGDLTDLVLSYVNYGQQ